MQVRKSSLKKVALKLRPEVYWQRKGRVWEEKKGEVGVRMSEAERKACAKAQEEPSTAGLEGQCSCPGESQREGEFETRLERSTWPNHAGHYRPN